MLISQRVSRSNEVANNIVFSFNLNSSTYSPCDMANWSKMERRTLIGSFSGPNFAMSTPSFSESFSCKTILQKE